MNYKAIIKKQSTIIAIAVICLTVATIGVSYALFFQVETNTNNQIVTAGTLNVEYGSGSSAIAATELVPMSDAEALSSSTMTGTIYIENTGTLPANYEVKIGDDTESFNSRSNAADTDELLSHDYIRIAAYLDGNVMVEPTSLADIETAADDKSMRSLFKSTLNTTGTGNNTATIVLKVWIDENAPESIISNYVYLKMDVTSEVLNANALPVEGTSSITLSDNAGENLVDYKIYGNSVQNGTPTPETPIEVESVGEMTENIYDKNTYPLSDGYISYITGDYNESPNYKCTKDYIPIKPNTIYYINYTASGSNPGIAFYDVNKKYISGVKSGFDITTPDNAKYMRFSVDAMVDIDAVQITYGYKIPVKISNGTEEYITNIYLNEPLRKIGEYVDYIDFENSKVVRNIKHVDLTVNNVYSQYMDGSASTYPTIVFPTEGTISGQGSTINGFSNRFEGVTRNSIYSGVGYGVAVNGNYIRLRYQGLTDDKDKFTEYLNANELYVEYVLATPTEKTIDLPNIPTLKGTCTLSVDTEIKPSRFEGVYNPN